MRSHAKYSEAVKAAADQVKSAVTDLLTTMEAAYPVGSRVRVNHCRGEYFGNVIGHSLHGCRIEIRNDRSGKTLGRWYQRS